MVFWECPREEVIALRSIFNSMKEPVAVTAVMVVVYTTLVCMGASLLAGVRPILCIAALGALLMTIAGAIGAPSAWLGSWWLEGPAAVLAVVGLILVSVSEFIANPAHVQWPGHVLGLSIIIALFFLGRAFRVWPYSYRPGVLPKSRLDEARERYEQTKYEYLAVVED